jgi:hypothetical protein
MAEEGAECFIFPLHFVTKPDSVTLVVLNPDEDLVNTKEAETNRLPQSFQFGMFTRGGFEQQWTRKNPPNTIERSLALLGQTPDSGRVRDVATFLAWDHKEQKRQVRVLGHRQAGVIGAYAAAHVPEAVFEVVLVDPPTSHRDGPHFLNVDRVLDLPTALGLLAPDVKLTLINAKDKAFDKTAAIYKLAGAEGKFERK